MIISSPSLRKARATAYIQLAALSSGKIRSASTPEYLRDESSRAMAMRSEGVPLCGP